MTIATDNYDQPGERSGENETKRNIPFKVMRYLNETLDPRGSRNYVLLMFLNRGKGFRGFFLNPYTPPDKRSEFDGLEDLERQIGELKRSTAERDLNEEIIRCYNNWISRGLTEHATAVIFLKGSDPKTYEGEVFSPKRNRTEAFATKIAFEKAVRRSVGLH